MGSTIAPNKQTLTGMYLTADAQGVDDNNFGSKPLENYLDVQADNAADTTTAMVKQVRLQLWDTAGAE